jgi:FdhD protein
MTFASRPAHSLPAGLSLHRTLPDEAAIAISCNGSTQAVMMGSPADLEDFARGFLLTEGLADPSEIVSIEPVAVRGGVDLRVWLTDAAAARLSARRRMMAGPVGCGMCGLDSLDEALRPPPMVASGLRLTGAQVLAAVAALPAHQPLHDATHAAHAAAFWTPGAGIIAAREDVGRHNALDKLAGALVRTGVPGASGAVVMTSRVSLDLVQKCARIGAPVLIAVSAPTLAALDAAQAAGITVAACARGGRVEVFTHPERIEAGGAVDVA